MKPLQFFKLFSYVSATVGVLMMTLSCIYLMIIKPRQLTKKRLLDETVDIISHGFQGSHLKPGSKEDLEK